jgi:hypothetical protein
MKPSIRSLAALWVVAQVLALPAASAQTPPADPGAQGPSDRTLAQASAASADSALPHTSFNDWVSEFEARFGQMVGTAVDGRTFFSGVANVRVAPNHPSYGKELALAYERALFDLQANFVVQNYGRQVARRLLQLMQDGSTNAEQFDPVELKRAQDQGRVAALFDKAIMLIDKRLDNELIKEGIPRERVAQLSVEQKKTTFRESLSKEIITTAVRNMQGLVPVQTRIFTQNTANGKVSRVGVIAVQSQKTRQFAQDLSRQRATLVKGEPNRLVDLLPRNEREYLDEIGLRFTYDERGRPMLISYGRWSLAVAKDWSPARVMSATQIATDQAKGLAESAIIEFMNTSIQVNDSKTVGSLSEEIARQVTRLDDSGTRNVEQTREQIGETIDKVMRTARSVAQGSLRGTSVVKRWEQADENGVVHVGTVVTWTYAQLDNANAIDAKPAGESGAPRSGPVRDESRQSRPINRTKDF